MSGKLKKQVFAYLDYLRASGIANMSGAAMIVCTEYGIEMRDAQPLVSEWRKKHTAADEVAQRIGAYRDEIDALRGALYSMLELYHGQSMSMMNTDVAAAVKKAKAALSDDDDATGGSDG